MKNFLHKKMSVASAILLGAFFVVFGNIQLQADYCIPGNDPGYTYYCYNYGYMPYAKVTDVKIYDVNNPGNLLLDDQPCASGICYQNRTQDGGVDEVDLPMGATYKLEWTSLGYQAYWNYSSRAYFDRNSDEIFDQDDEDEYLYVWGLARHNTSTYSGTCPTWSYGWAWNPGAGGRHSWRTHEVEFELPCDGVKPGQTRLRVMACALYVMDDPCINAYTWEFLGNTRYYAYYGQVFDYEVNVQGVITDPIPAKDGLLYADEVYNNETRKAKVDPNGPDILFSKPAMRFEGQQPTGTKMRFWIMGPLPSKQVVYRAVDAQGNTDILIDNLPFDASIGKYKWEAGYTGVPDAGVTDVFVRDDQNRLLTDGSIYGAIAGEYSLGTQFVTDAGGGCSEPIYSQFTFRAENDMTTSRINFPRTSEFPTFEKYMIGQNIKMEAVFKNIGLKNISTFKAKYEVFEEDANGDYTILYRDGEYTYDKSLGIIGTEPGNNEKTVLLGTVTINTVGKYSVRISVTDINDWGTGDDEPFNDFYPRPSGGDKVNGWQFANHYFFEVVYDVDVAATEIEFPINDPQAPEDEVIVNRPFKPRVHFQNFGKSDASNSPVTFKIFDADDKLVAIIPELGEQSEVKIVPAGRYNSNHHRFKEEIVLEKAGTYKAVATISNTDEPFEATDNNNTVELTFDVIEGLQGTWTVGTLFAGEPKNFNTIQEAMSEMYFRGISGSIVFELTDANYDLQSDIPWDFASIIIGLGDDKDGDGVPNSITFKPHKTRAVVTGGININLTSTSGVGINFGQGFRNASNPLAPVNTSNKEGYVKSPGFITIDGGDLKAVQINMTTQSNFCAPVYLGNGSHDITIRNLIIRNMNEVVNGSMVHLPLKEGDAINNDIEFEGNMNNGESYSAGIVSRNAIKSFEDVEEENPGFVGVSVENEPNHNNVIDGNDISGFGYGIVSLGYGILFEAPDYIEYSSYNNVYTNNIISNVARAGIAIGNEKESEISYNTITDVHVKQNSSMDQDGQNYESAGILIGGLINQVNNGGDHRKGYATMHLDVNGNKIANVESDFASYGIKIEQNRMAYGETDITYYPGSAEENDITNNMIKDINVTSMSADRFGIRLMTERDGDGHELLAHHPDFLGYTTRNDRIANNTIIMNNPNGQATDNNAVFAGIAIQQTSGTEVYNNAVAVTDDMLDPTADFSSLLLVQGHLPKDGGPKIDNNAYHIDMNSSAVITRFVEMEPNKEDILYVNSREDFVNLEQWRVWTGSDWNSIQSRFDSHGDLVDNFMDAYELTDYDVNLKLENGKMPLGSVLNNRGRNLKWLTTDIDGANRGITLQNYDIGFKEFKGRKFATDMQMIRVESPAAYRSTNVEMTTGVDFTDADYVMTEAPVNITARFRNDGSNFVTDARINLTIERMSASATWTPVLETTSKVSLGASENGVVDYMLADGMGDEFMPKTYAELALEGENYAVDAKFTGMETNVTPIYRITLTTSADEKNSNNTTSKDVRFYIKKGELNMVITGTDKGNTYYDETNTQYSQAWERVTGRANSDAVQNVLSQFDWVNTITEDDMTPDYDYFDRKGWEKRSVNYGMYKNLVWTGSAEDQFTQTQVFDLDAFLENSEAGNKSNLIFASQYLAMNNEMAGNAYLNTRFLSSDYQGVPVDGFYEPADPANDPAWTVTGDDIATGYTFDISDQHNVLYANHVDYANLRPMPIAIQGSTDNSSNLSEAFLFDTVTKDNAHRFNKAMGVTSENLRYNTIYLGADWRHFSRLDIAFKGILDWLDANDGAIYPISLTHFDATRVNNQVEVEWTTASEINSNKFDVERSLVTENGFNNFSTIETVKAAGNSSIATNYGITDFDVVMGNTYAYRLNMYDVDGTEYSEVVTVEMGSEDGMLTIEKVTPNPTAGISTITYKMTSAMNVTVNVYDITGNLVSTPINNQLVSASNANTVNIDLSNNANGVYTVIITAGDLKVDTVINVAK